MKITVTTLTDEIFVLDVSEDLELENFKAFCEVESGFPAPETVIVFNGRPLLDDKKSLKDHGVKDGDCVVLQHMLQAANSAARPRPNLESALSGMDFSDIRVPGVPGQPQPPLLPQPQPQLPVINNNPIANNGNNNSSNSNDRSNAPFTVGMEDDPAYIREMLLSRPDQVALLKQNNPKLADALLSGNLQTFSKVLREQIQARVQRQLQRVRMMQADPFDTEAQRMIAEEIRQKNIEANMEAAMEYNPETFGTVAMLYINCKVNGVPVKAFIDSGAQTTIMSASCAERCNINRLVDTRWAGIAKGVGVQRVIGRIHMVQMQIEKDFLTTSFSVLEEQPMDMLLGLDMLKRHQCNIDLQRNVLRIGTTGTETRFLPESELPECARLSGTPDDSLKSYDESVKTVEEMEISEAIRRSKNDMPTTSGVSSSTQSKSTTQAPTPMQVDSGKQTTPTPTPEHNFSEKDIAEIVKLGFSVKDVIEALKDNNGDKTQATAALFAKSFKF